MKKNHKMGCCFSRWQGKIDVSGKQDGFMLCYGYLRYYYRFISGNPRIPHLLCGTRFARNSISYKITWYSWKNKQALACGFSFTLPRCFMRLLWLYQFVDFDPSQSCFHLMFLRYWFNLCLYYLFLSLWAWDCCMLSVYKCYVLSLNASCNWTHCWEAMLLNLSISFFLCWSLFLLSYLQCFPRLFGACIWAVSINPRFFLATYGREGNGLRAGHGGSMCRNQFSR